MDAIDFEVLQAAKFRAQRTSCHVLETTFEPTSGLDTKYTESELDIDALTNTCGQQHNSHRSDIGTAPPSQFNIIGTLVCLLQNERCLHRSGKRDKLPFQSSKAARQGFQAFNLPTSYFRVVCAAVAVAYATIVRGDGHVPCRLEFVANCISKQADWGFALSHEATSNTTSVFWSLGWAARPELLLA